MKKILAFVLITRPDFNHLEINQRSQHVIAMQINDSICLISY